MAYFLLKPNHQSANRIAAADFICQNVKEFSNFERIQHIIYKGDMFAENEDDLESYYVSAYTAEAALVTTPRDKDKSKSGIHLCPDHVLMYRESAGNDRRYFIYEINPDDVVVKSNTATWNEIKSVALRIWVGKLGKPPKLARS